MLCLCYREEIDTRQLLHPSYSLLIYWYFALSNTSAVLHSDKRRNRIKTLDEYYHIRANITCASIAQEILDQSKLTNAAAAKKDSSRTTVVLLVMLLLLTWLYLILSVSTDIFEKHPITFETVLTPISLVASGISHMLHPHLRHPMPL